MSIESLTSTDGLEGLILFRAQDNSYTIYSMALNSSTVTQLTDYQYPFDEYPAPSPDGRQLAYVSVAYKVGLDRVAWDLVVRSLENSTNAMLSEDHYGVNHPTWSPDGTQLAFAAINTTDEYQWDIYTIDVSDGTIQQLTNNPAADFDPAWSPNGNSITFTSARYDTTDVMIMNANGTNQRPLNSSYLSNVAESDPAWSPDGSMIAFSCLQAPNDYAVCVLDSSTYGDLEMVVRHGSDPAWSPDGSNLVVVNGDWLYIHAADGSDLNEGFQLTDEDTLGSYCLRTAPLLCDTSQPEWAPAPPPTLVVQASDDFEFFNDAVWTLPNNWSYVQTIDRPNMGMFLLDDETPLPYGSAIYDDLAVQARLWVELGSAVMTVRYDEVEDLGYSVVLSADGGVSLYRGDELLASASVENISYGPPWHTVNSKPSAALSPSRLMRRPCSSRQTWTRYQLGPCNSPHRMTVALASSWTTSSCGYRRKRSSS